MKLRSCSLLAWLVRHFFLQMKMRRKESQLLLVDCITGCSGVGARGELRGVTDWQHYKYVVTCILYTYLTKGYEYIERNNCRKSFLVNIKEDKELG